MALRRCQNGLHDRKLTTETGGRTRRPMWLIRQREALTARGGTDIQSDCKYKMGLLGGVDGYSGRR
jgi:hypothetical protein